MKASVAAGIILVLILALVMGNAFYVNHVTAHMEDMVNALPDIPTEATPQDIREIYAYIEKRKTLLGFSVGFSVIDRVMETTEALAAYAASNGFMDYAVTKATLSDAIRDMGRLEKPSMMNIF